MRVALVDLKAQYFSIRDEIDEVVARVHSKGLYVMGPEVEAFEEEWARYCGSVYGVAVSSGTDALYLTLKYFREVEGGTIANVPAFTFIATAEAAVRAGMSLRLVDVDSEGCMLPGPPPSVRSIDIPVNMYGRLAPIVTDRLVTDRLVVEDAAQSHGLQARGDASCYSFYPTKNLGAHGQAGAVVTSSLLLRDYIRSMRNHGESNKRFVHDRLSGNYRMDELQAAILRVKLKYLDRWNARRRQIAQLYVRLLSDDAIAQVVQMPSLLGEHVFHMFVVRVAERGSLTTFLEFKGIQTAVRYPVPLHLQPCLAGHVFYTQDAFPGAKKLAERNVSLPIYPEMSDDQVEYVATQVREWVLFGSGA